MRKILVVEDDPVLLRHLKILLGSEGFTCEAVASLKDFDQLLLHSPASIFSAMIMDWNLPDGEGIELVAKIRGKEPLLPIILLTARTDLTDKVLGIKAGATDYVAKPFEPLELAARLQRHIAQAEAAAASRVDDKQSLVRQEISLNTATHEVFYQGNPVDLTKLQFDLLKFFMEHPNVVFSRDDLLEKVWGLERYPTTRTVDNHVVQLRQKFKAELFETVHGVGYKFLDRQPPKPIP